MWSAHAPTLNIGGVRITAPTLTPALHLFLKKQNFVKKKNIKKNSISGQRTVWLTVWVWTFLSFECSLWSALEHWWCTDYPKENTAIYDPFVLN